MKKKMLEIRVYGGCAKGEVLEVDLEDNPDTVVSIGRGRNCKLQLNDPILSKHQCKIVAKANKWQIIDEGSTNGTWIYMGNSTKVVEGMIIRCGSTYYCCSILS